MCSLTSGNIRKMINFLNLANEFLKSHYEIVTYLFNKRFLTLYSEKGAQAIGDSLVFGLDG